MRTAAVASLAVSRFIDFRAFIIGHCFSSDTELLTMEGWKLKDDIQEGTLVATMSKETKGIEFEPVQAKYVYDHYTECHHFESSAMDHLVTSDHGMVVETRSGKLQFPKAKDWPSGETYVRVSGQTNSGYDGDWSLSELRLLVQCITDGSCEGGKYWRWHFKKPRKIERLAKLLGVLEIDFTVSDLSSEGTRKIYVGALPDKFTKELPAAILGMSAEQLTAIVDEWSYTDGTRYSEELYQLQTNVKSHADLLSAACALAGHKATVNQTDSGYTLSVRKWVQRVRQQGSVAKGAVPYSGEVFCVSVNNGTLLTRRNGKTIITQNTHKVGQMLVGEGPYLVEQGCSCLMQPYQFKRVVSTTWWSAYNISEFKDGKIVYDNIKNYIRGTLKGFDV
jgi:hypothetical protein